MKDFAAVLLTMLVMDGLWLGVIQKDYVSRKIREINGSQPLAHPAWTFALAYLLMASALYLFCVKDRRPLWQAAFLGLTVYGVFDLTMHNLVARWGLSDVFMDMAWGVTVFTVSAWVGLQFR
jgi:uncharacterized membrane protein